MLRTGAPWADLPDRYPPYQTCHRRTDFFNVLNQVNLGNPNTTLSNGNFGKITSAAAPRMLQFGLKLIL